MDEEELRNELKESIDLNSLEFWLLEIGQICRDKAAHIRENWQDEKLARDWDLAANAVEKCATSAPVSYVS